MILSPAGANGNYIALTLLGLVKEFEFCYHMQGTHGLHVNKIKHVHIWDDNFVNLLNDELPYNGIWTSSMILTFVLALSGIQLAPNVSMITYASKDPGYFATQQIWFSAF